MSDAELSAAEIAAAEMVSVELVYEVLERVWDVEPDEVAPSVKGRHLLGLLLAELRRIRRGRV